MLALLFGLFSTVVFVLCWHVFLFSLAPGAGLALLHTVLRSSFFSAPLLFLFFLSVLPGICVWREIGFGDNGSLWI